MSVRKSSGKSRLGAIAPVDHALVKVLSNIREKNYQSSSDQQRFTLTAREMLVLGRLKSSWKDIVGVQLAHKTCPSRLLRGKLYLLVADSQWLQTLVFIKGKIIEKLQQRFPDLKIVDLIGKPGRIPDEVEELVKECEWPDWQEFAPLPLNRELDSELALQINRCRQKMLARNTGLKKKGLRACRRCQAGLTSSADQICALCVSAERSELLKPVKELLKDMPWLAYDEIVNFQQSVKSYEYEAIKADLLCECHEMIKEYGMQLKEFFDEEIFAQMKKEMVRAVMLHCRCMPDQVDLYNLRPEQAFAQQWHELLNLKKEEEAC